MLRIYDPTSTSSMTSKIINELILKQLFPQYGIILSDQDPLPLFGKHQKTFIHNYRIETSECNCGEKLCFCWNFK